MTRAISVFVLSACGTGGAVAADPLTIGSPAPPLKVPTWVKGDPVGGIERGTVYVVEFWATTCGPCIRCMPHLTDLQRRHKAVVFACLSDEPEQAVRDFVAKNDRNMGFRVGVDEKGRMWKSWMEAAGLQGIPTAFVVDAAGVVAWIGNPAELDEPLRQIMGGKYDPQPAIIRLRFQKARKEAFRRENERLDRGNRLAERVEELIGQKEAAEAAALVDEAIRKEPGERVWYGQMKLQALVSDPKLAGQALEFGTELAAAVAAGAKHSEPTHRALLSIASRLTSGTPPDPRCCDLAVVIVSEAEEAARQDRDSAEEDRAELRFDLDSVLAYAHAGRGAFDKAAGYAEAALKACGKLPPRPGEDEKLFRRRVEGEAKALAAALADFKKKAGAAPPK